MNAPEESYDLVDGLAGEVCGLGDFLGIELEDASGIRNRVEAGKDLAVALSLLDSDYIREAESRLW